MKRIFVDLTATYFPTAEFIVFLPNESWKVLDSTFCRELLVWFLREKSFPVAFSFYYGKTNTITLQKRVVLWIENILGIKNHSTFAQVVLTRSSRIKSNEQTHTFPVIIPAKEWISPPHIKLSILVSILRYMSQNIKFPYRISKICKIPVEELTKKQRYDYLTNIFSLIGEEYVQKQQIHIAMAMLLAFHREAMQFSPLRYFIQKTEDDSCVGIEDLAETTAATKLHAYLDKLMKGENRHHV